MLTLPKIVEREAQPYAAVRDRVTLDEMMPVVDRSFQTLFRWLAGKGLEPAGAAFFKYNLIDMERELEMEFAVPLAKAAAGDGDVLTSVLPAGRYAEVTWTGPYDALFDVNAVLIGWAKEKGVHWDMQPTGEGDRFAARLEIYENNPAEIDDPRDLITTLTIRIAD